MYSRLHRIESKEWGEWKIRNTHYNITVDDVLENLGSTPLDQRVSVLAVGSNASPAQLLLKFSNSTIDSVIPVIPCSVVHLSVRPSAHISKYGAIPYAPRHSTKFDRVRLMLCLLSDEQLSDMDKSEGGNYDRVVIENRIPVMLDNDEMVYNFQLYRGKRGILDIPTKTVFPTQYGIWNSLNRLFPDFKKIYDNLTIIGDGESMCVEFEKLVNHHELRKKDNLERFITKTKSKYFDGTNRTFW